MKKINILLLISALLLMTVSQQSFGKNKKKGDKGSKQQYQCKMISRGSAISQAKRQTNGKVVGVKLDGRGSRAVYRVRVLVDKKRVKTISIQACR